MPFEYIQSREIMSRRKPGNRVPREGGNSPCRILVVDDNENICRLYLATLTDAGYQVIRLRNARKLGYVDAR